MRLFFVHWAEQRPELVDVASALQEQGHEIVYWTRSSDTFDLDTSRFPRTVFHNQHDALHGRPAAGVPAEDFAPPSKELVARMQEAESVTLRFLYKPFGQLSPTELEHIFYTQLRYWHGVFQWCRPNVVIFALPPHAFPDYLIYALAKNSGIPTIMFYNFFIADTSFLLSLEDYTVGSLTLAAELQKNSGKNFSLNYLSADLQKYFRANSLAPTGSAPRTWLPILDGSAKRVIRINKIKLVWKSMKDFSLPHKVFFSIRKKWVAQSRDEYMRLQMRPDFEKKYIYVPLHYQPECSTNTLGGIFDDQILMIEMLSAAVPSDWVMYVKEHPAQWLLHGHDFSLYRYRGYYERIARLKNVFLIPVETGSFTLIHTAQTVATVTGTAGWEAIMRGKLALIFGYPWYQQCPGVRQVYDVYSCRAAIKEIMDGGRVAPQSIINYLQAVDTVARHGYFDSCGKQSAPLSEQENRNNILFLLSKEIERVKKNS